MKLSLNTDFTKLPRAGSFLRAGEVPGGVVPFDVVALDHDERRLRRRVLSLKNGGQILVDLLKPAELGSGDLLVLEDGRHVGIELTPTEVFAVRARDAVHLAELAWHVGSRHLPAAIEADRIVISRDPAVRHMLEGLGAEVMEAEEPFTPLRSTYAGHEGHGHAHHDHDHHGHDHHHGGHDHHSHAHGHGEPDKYGRLPGDPHYGHNHA